VFAEITAGTLKRPVDFAARWGGEEFVVLLPGTGADGAVDVAERVRKNVEAAVIPAQDGGETRITVSIGVNAVIPGEGDSVKAFIENADQALYRAKEAGRNRYMLSHG